MVAIINKLIHNIGYKTAGTSAEDGKIPLYAIFYPYYPSMTFHNPRLFSKNLAPYL